MDADLVELKVAVGRMAERIDMLAKIVDRQAETIESLVALSNQGRGAAWILIGMGGIAGAVISKLLTFLPFLVK